MQNSAPSYHQLESALRQSEARWRRLAVNRLVIVYQFRLCSDGTWNFPWIGDNCLNLLEIEPAVLQHSADRLIALIHPDDRAEFDRSVGESAARLQPWNWEGRFLLPSGKTRWIQAASSPERQANGDVLWDGLLLDISDRKRTEETLMLYKRAVDSSSDAIGIAQPDGTLFYQNAAYAKLFGCETPEQFNQTGGIPACYADAEKVPAVLEAIANGQDWSEEVDQVSRCGRRFPAFVRANGLRDETGNLLGIVGTITDMSDRKRVERELREAQQFLDSVLKALPIGVLIKDAQELRFAMLNQTAIDLLDLNQAEVLGKNDYDLFPPEQADLFVQVDRAVLASKTVMEIPAEAVQVKGKARIFRTKKTAVLNSAGEPKYLVVITEDITDRKQAEIALAQTTRSLKKAQQIAHIGNWEYDVATQTVIWSDESYRIFGMSEPGQPVPPLAELMQAYHPDDRPRLEKAFSRAIQAGVPYRDDFRIVRPDGSIRYVDTKAEVTVDSLGNVVSVFGTILDITDRKLTEDALMLFKRAVDSSSDAIAIAKPDGTQSYQNAVFSDLYGCDTVDEFNQTGGIVACFVDPEMAFAMIQTSAQGQKWVKETLNQSRQGRMFPALIRASGIKDDAGNLLGLVGSITDITDRKQAETALQQKVQQEQLLNQLANQIRSSLDIDEILQTAVESIQQLLQVDNCNFVWYRPHAIPPSWEATHEAKTANVPSQLGFYPSDAIGMAAEQLLSLKILQHDDVSQIADPQWQEIVASLGAKSTIDVPLLTSMGDIGVISCTQCSSLRPWQASEVELLKLVANQLAIALNQAELYKRSRLATAQAQAQAQELEQALQTLQRTQAKLVQTEKMSGLGQLVAGVAHEINNPVNFIHGNLSYVDEYARALLQLIKLYQQHCPVPSPALQAAIEAIDLDFLITDLPKLLTSMKVGTDRIREIVLALRSFSRIDEAEKKTVNIHDGIDSTLLILQNRLREQPDRPSIQVIKQYGKLPLIDCYPGQLNQVFMNVLSNAIDALEERDHKRSFQEMKQNPSQIQIITGVNSGYASIRIIDNGVGIPEAIQKQLFDPFFTTKPVGKGTGLGMSISHQIITEKHNGSLRCQSSFGQGAEFIIEIPLKATPNHCQFS